MSFTFNSTHSFNVFCEAISPDRRFAPPLLTFVRDIRISVPGPHLRCIREANAGLTLLTERAVNLKRFELAARQSSTRVLDTRADIWCGEARRLLKKTLRILGSFRGLESFDVYLMMSRGYKHLLNRNETRVITRILRELVSQPKGSGVMTARQFHNHFKARYQALMEQS
jgi:hypothetical protein